MKTTDMAKENNFVLREAAKSAQMGYYDHLAAGGKGDPAEERWIEALIAGADAITLVAVLESRLAQVERERDAAVEDLGTEKSCQTCKHGDIYNSSGCEGNCRSCSNISCPCESCNYKWRGVCPENTKEDSK